MRGLSYGILLVLLLQAATTQAQQYAIGLRHGASFWMTKNSIGKGSLRTPPGQHFTYDKELYLRIDARSKWDYEAGISHYKFDVDRNIHVAEMVQARQRVQVVDLKLSLQYDVTYPLLGYMFPALSKMKTYVGFATTPRLQFERIDIKETGERIDNTSVSVLFAFSYTHIIPVSKRWSVSSSLSFSAMPFDKHLRDKDDFYDPNRRIAWHGGMLYKL